ncbi:MFS transporter [Devosia limi DSM 17137]|uniref:MFS transporter n=1 Tax=Devosia limi DSM 17137 TaxID=1121477 RepID=A0A0F5L255_9HYPH|nr:MFS transporter [Devosia limi]KKB76280.1 MFS transporter [Devosia limi DSM 17137]SHE60810.1 Predicted arabinose efflux permease, MFS family [Devosia limi DSM 17137]
MSTSSIRPAVPLLVLIIAGCIIAAIGNGIRTSFGLFTLPMTTDLGLSREGWGMAMAIQNLAWGIAQPFAGNFADRVGTGRTIAAGAVVYAAGVILMAFSPTAGIMMVTGGIITGVGIAICSFSVVMAAFGRSVPVEKRSLIFGVATAASSFGQFAFAPISQGFINAFGWQTALIYLGMMLLLIIPLSFALRGKTEQTVGQADLPFMEALSKAWGYGSYRLLVIGFFVCGFHLAFINVHMPAYLVQCGLSPEVGSWTIAVIGLFNIVGSLLSGYLGGKLPKQMLLATIYFLRAVAIGLFMLFPVTELTAYTFAAAMGVLWLSTVPLTAGLVSLFFGARYMGMLYGIAFFSHQLGSFMGVWLGGVVFDLTGHYDLVWYLGIVLGLASAAIHIPINERSATSFAMKPA